MTSNLVIVYLLVVSLFFYFFFFFQAEDGIRDYKVTGVQTCALPISTLRGRAHFMKRFFILIVVGMFCVIAAATETHDEVRALAREIFQQLIEINTDRKSVV